jgi:hypothetical protein
MYSELCKIVALAQKKQKKKWCSRRQSSDFFSSTWNWNTSLEVENKQLSNNRNDQPCKNEKGFWTQETHKKLSEDGKDSEDYTGGGTNKISDRVET